MITSAPGVSTLHSGTKTNAHLQRLKRTTTRLRQNPNDLNALNG